MMPPPGRDIDGTIARGGDPGCDFQIDSDVVAGGVLSSGAFDHDITTQGSDGVLVATNPTPPELPARPLAALPSKVSVLPAVPPVMTLPPLIRIPQGAPPRQGCRKILSWRCCQCQWTSPAFQPALSRVEFPCVRALKIPTES